MSAPDSPDVTDRLSCPTAVRSSEWLECCSACRVALGDTERPRVKECPKCHELFYQKPSQEQLKALVRIFVTESLPTIEATRCPASKSTRAAHSWWDGKCVRCGADFDATYKTKQAIALNNRKHANK